MENNDSSNEIQSQADPSPFPEDGPEPATPTEEPVHSDSIEDELRRLAEVEREASPGEFDVDDDPPIESEPSAETLLQATSVDDMFPDSDDAAEDASHDTTLDEEVNQATPTPVANLKPSVNTKPRQAAPASGVGAAHEALTAACIAHASLIGLKHIPQTSYNQFLDPPTGQKVYVAVATKTLKVHIETTLPLVKYRDPNGPFGDLRGRFKAEPPRKKTGQITSVLDPSVEDGALVIELLDLLVSGQLGRLPGPTRRVKST